jgi:hypothetical protein
MAPPLAEFIHRPEKWVFHLLEGQGRALRFSPCTFSAIFDQIVAFERCEPIHVIELEVLARPS